MNRNNVLNTAKKIYALVDNKLFTIAFVFLRSLISELSQWWANSRCEELESLCSQMLKYSLGEVEDPERDKIVAKLQYDLYVLVDDVVEALAIKGFSTYSYEQKRLSAHSDWRIEGVSDILTNRNEDAFDDKVSAAFDTLFRKIWLMDRMTEDDSKSVCKLIMSEDILIPARTMAISALMLKGLRYYDSAVWNILAASAECNELEIRIRALVALVMLNSVYDSRIKKDRLVSDKIMRLLQNEQTAAELDIVYNHIINTFGTDKVTHKIKNEIYPELIKSSSKLRDMLKHEKNDLKEEDAFNPEWDNSVDDEAFDKLKQFNEMQMKGDDVYMSTFSGMKGFAFFSEIAHWFMPFDTRQHDVAAQLSVMPELVTFFADSVYICDSDKYSFIYSLSQIPAESLKSMMSGLGGDADALKEELGLENWKKDEKMMFHALTKNYVLDLFRFYRLFPHRNDFINPFNSIGLFEDDSFLLAHLPLNLIKSICKYLFNVECFDKAKPLFEYLDSQQVWDAYFYQQMGHCYQSLGLWNEAIGCFEKSDLLEPNDVWTLKHKALCFRRVGDADQAVECYKNILSIKEDDLSATIHMADCYMLSKRYSEARSLYYKAHYIKPDNIRIAGALAWCLFMEGDYVNAWEMYDVLIGRGDLSANDAINAGHTAWACGNKERARQCYKQAQKIINNDIDFASKIIADAMYLRPLGLNDDDIVILINQVLSM